jgi:hypothetical protein
MRCRCQNFFLSLSQGGKLKYFWAFIKLLKTKLKTHIFIINSPTEQYPDLLPAQPELQYLTSSFISIWDLLSPNMTLHLIFFWLGSTHIQGLEEIWPSALGLSTQRFRILGVL